MLMLKKLGVIAPLHSLKIYVQYLHVSDTFFFRILCWIQSSKIHSWFHTEIFCNVISPYSHILINLMRPCWLKIIIYFQNNPYWCQTFWPMVHIKYTLLSSGRLSGETQSREGGCWFTYESRGQPSGGRRERKHKDTRTHTLILRTPGFLFSVLTLLSLVWSLSSLKERPNKPVLASATGPATVIVWPMTSSARHSGRVIQERT